MVKHLSKILSFLVVACTLAFSYGALQADPLFSSTENLPVSFQGRFRSLDSMSRLWLNDLYHNQKIKSDDVALFELKDPSALSLLWKYHFLGHTPFDSMELFYIGSADIKTLLNLSSDLKKDRFSYNKLMEALYTNKTTSESALRLLIAYDYSKRYLDMSNRTKSDKMELKDLAEGLWVTLKGNDLILLKAPDITPWNNLNHLTVIEKDAKNHLLAIDQNYKGRASQLQSLMQAISLYRQSDGGHFINDDYLKTYSSLQKENYSPSEIDSQLDSRFPLSKRLLNSGNTLKMLPSRYKKGEWISLHALNLKVYNESLNKIEPIANFTALQDADFNQVRKTYTTLSSAALKYFKTPDLQAFEDLKKASLEFSTTYFSAYETIADLPYKEASGKMLYYPSIFKLKIETLYFKLSLIEFASVAYLLALIIFWIAYKTKRKSLNKTALLFIITGFILHTLILIMRCYILSRPPVSNMFETIIYVPWISIVMGLLFYLVNQSALILSASTLTSLGLLIILKLTNLDSRLENVQAVLDSQYWLIIHVLMVVGSYGAFAVCGILGHFYLIALYKTPEDQTRLQNIAKTILYTMYVGVALLIPGTILGGVWAAESWGRFWDWDPKESWAFISACVYLLVIHAYTFNRISDKGLAIGSILGLIAISFTWYGVNYVLGSGLHTYGFGSGGEAYYYLYVGFELIFMISLSGGMKKYFLK